MSKSLLSKLAAAAVIASVLPAAGQGRSPAPPLPEGPGRELVLSQCGACHALSVVTGSPGYSAETWLSLFRTMVVLPEDQSAIVAGYLARSFPGKPQPNASVLPRDVEVAFREWAVPSPNSVPHDALATRDGAIWWSGQDASVLGRLDPLTGDMKEFKTRTPRSRPRGLVVDHDGHLWFAASARGYIGRLDPRTGTITEYPMKNRSARDPESLQFSQQGILWFTVPGANMVGRLDPTNGKMTIVASPTPNSSPGGVAINSKGIPFFVESGANKIASVDPNTMAIREYVLPADEARPRRLTITGDDRIWYADYSRGYLGRLDPETGAVTEWPSPGGPQSQPYGMTVLNDIIWYSESNVRPNTLVRFDPRTQKFRTWPIPSGVVVRNMTTTGGATLVMACSGANRVVLVDVKGDGASR